FAQLGTELDPVTQAQLDRGYRVLEILKQPNNSPTPVEEQVISIFAVTKGFMDTIPTAKVREFEAFLLKTMREQHAEILEEIRTAKEVKQEAALQKTIKSIVEHFLAKNN
ncbi:F0F1 ATP synthase subunit alpha, partial [Leptospira sp. mixed culture ATI2-C-A1]